MTNIDGQELTIHDGTVEFEDIMYNPEVLKLLSKLAEMATEIATSVNDSSTIQAPLKIGIKHTLDEINSTINVIKDLVSTPIDKDGKINTGSVGALPVLELVEFTVSPPTKEVTMNGVTTRLAKAEFTVLYTLASNAGSEVYLGTQHTLLTRLSKIRREIPGIKLLIESLGGGRYVLNCRFKKPKTDQK